MLIIFIPWKSDKPEKLDELLNKYNDATYIVDRKIKVKLKEIIACCEECSLEERDFSYEIINKFCELMSLMEERNEDERQSLICKYEGIETDPECKLNNFVAYQFNQGVRKEGASAYRDSESLLIDFYDSFIEKKSAATMKDYVARVKTFAYSEQYLNAMLHSGELGVKEIDMDPILFTYENIEMILAKFNTKDETGVAIKQRNNIRSALRMLNEFKQK